MNNMNEQSLLQEIEEDLARQRTEKLWKKYGPYVIGAALAIVLVTAGTSGYKSYRTVTAQKATTVYLDLFEKNKDKTEDLIAGLDSYSQENKGKIQAVLARLNEAAKLMDLGKKDKALEIYAGLAGETSVEPMYRQLADLLYVQSDMDTGDIAALEVRLQPLMAESCVWHFTAREYAGYLAIRQGDKEKAKKIFTELKNLPVIPKSINARSTDVLRWLNEGA